MTNAHKYTPVAVPVYGEEVDAAVAALQEGFVTPVGADTVVSYIFCVLVYGNKNNNTILLLSMHPHTIFLLFIHTL